jgi:hypothetical protein
MSIEREWSDTFAGMNPPRRRTSSGLLILMNKRLDRIAGRAKLLYGRAADFSSEKRIVIEGALIVLIPNM